MTNRWKESWQNHSPCINVIHLIFSRSLSSDVCVFHVSPLVGGGITISLNGLCSGWFCLSLGLKLVVELLCFLNGNGCSPFIHSPVPSTIPGIEEACCIHLTVLWLGSPCHGFRSPLQLIQTVSLGNSLDLSVPISLCLECS